MSEETKIGFRFLGLQTEQFAVFEENYKDTNKPNFQLALEYRIKRDEKRFGCFTSMMFEIRKKPFLKLEVSSNFQILDEFWNEFVKDDQIIFPKGFVQHLTAISVSSARGVLHSKTEGTKYNKFFLPLINVEKLVDDDIKFQLEID
ncbi:hypothetical protein [Flagellimonas marinaquae]